MKHERSVSSTVFAPTPVSHRSSNNSESHHNNSNKDKKTVAAFIFRRDFRLHDNTALIKLAHEAQRASMPILPLFFFNPAECEAKLNPYFGHFCFKFMCESLNDLDQSQLNDRLVCLRGSDEQCLKQIEQSGLRLSMIGFNCDYTPFAMVRDERLEEYCLKHSIECVKSEEDYTLLPLDTVVNGSNEPYSMFTPFYRKVISEHASQVRPVDATKFHIDRVFLENGKKYLSKYLIDPISLIGPDTETYKLTTMSTEKGGRTEGLKRVKEIENLQGYKQERDFLGRDKTSHLSPHLKFGTVSIRESWHTAVQSLGLDHALVRQFIWREFYCVLIYYHPRLVQGQLNVFRAANDKKLKLNAPFQAKYDKFKWK